MHLRNLASNASTSRDDDAMSVEESLTERDHKPIRGFRQIRLRQILLLLSLLLNFVGGLKLLLSRSSPNRILTYCKRQVPSNYLNCQ